MGISWVLDWNEILTSWRHKVMLNKFTNREYLQQISQIDKSKKLLRSETKWLTNQQDDDAN